MVQAQTFLLNFVLCALLAFQFGLQPLLSQKFQHPSVSKVAIVFLTEFVKILLAVFALITNSAEFSKIRKTWSWRSSLQAAAIPAALFIIQNLCIQYAFQRLDHLTFNLINQTKTLSSALFLYLLLDQKQSLMQIFALLLILLAAILLTVEEVTINSLTSGSFFLSIFSLNSNKNDSSVDVIGVLLTLTASALSGLSGALSQRALSGESRNSFLFSAELGFYGVIALASNELYYLYQYNNGLFVELTDNNGDFFSHWSLLTVVPIVSNALGGLIVGLVVKYAGSIAKGFALIAGIIISGLVQWIFGNQPLTLNSLLAALLVIVATYFHINYPLQTVDKVKTK